MSGQLIALSLIKSAANQHRGFYIDCRSIPIISLKEKIQEIEAMKVNIEIIPVTSDFANMYGILKHTLQKKGSRIGALDEVFAATSLGFDRKIITQDSHFLSCPGIEVLLY